jgi:hypothetical protein
VHSHLGRVLTWGAFPLRRIRTWGAFPLRARTPRFESTRPPQWVQRARRAAAELHGLRTVAAAAVATRPSPPLRCCSRAPPLQRGAARRRGGPRQTAVADRTDSSFQYFATSSAAWPLPSSAAPSLTCRPSRGRRQRGSTMRCTYLRASGKRALCKPMRGLIGAAVIHLQSAARGRAAGPKWGDIPLHVVCCMLSVA